mmetsp:Transcript_3155/g.6025  ORF Transcript_3155/g.6025 Transcript_3155/m.6025 type:complete len:236 (+) Transcript_3155:66-773(+)|eukprot:scaffold2914_cov178-Amphora_coffeaeformis.AAC.13
MATHISHILQANKEAVKCLTEKKSREAYNLLSQGLRALHSVIENRSPVLGKWAQASGCNVAMPVQLPSSLTDLNMNYSPDNFFQLFENAFVISHEAISTMHPHVFQDRAVAVILYNTGLLCHRQGLLRGDSKMIQRALFLYENARSTLGLCNDYGTETDKLDDGVLRMALISNMGHIHSYLFNFEEAKWCKGALENLIQEHLSSFVEDEPDAPNYHFFLASLQFREFAMTLAPAA